MNIVFFICLLISALPVIACVIALFDRLPSMSSQLGFDVCLLATRATRLRVIPWLSARVPDDGKDRVQRTRQPQWTRPQPVACRLPPTTVLRQVSTSGVVTTRHRQLAFMSVAQKAYPALPGIQPSIRRAPTECHPFGPVWPRYAGVY